MNGEHLSIEQAAAHLGLAPSTIRAYRSRGLFAEPTGEQWGRPYWTTEALDAWQRDRPGTPGRPPTRRPQPPAG